jgi:hypothetical protein
MNETMDCPECGADGWVYGGEYENGREIQATCSKCGGAGIVPKCERATCAFGCTSETDHCQSCGEFVPVEGEDYCQICINADEGNFISLSLRG